MIEKVIVKKINPKAKYIIFKQEKFRGMEYIVIGPVEYRGGSYITAKKITEGDWRGHYLVTGQHYRCQSLEGLQIVKKSIKNDKKVRNCKIIS